MERISYVKIIIMIFSLKIGQNREISKGYTLWPLFGQIINYFLFNFNLFVLKVYVVLKVSYTVVMIVVDIFSIDRAHPKDTRDL